MKRRGESIKKKDREGKRGRGGKKETVGYERKHRGKTRKRKKRNREKKEEKENGRGERMNSWKGKREGRMD